MATTTNINIAQYTRPDIYINEIDNSVVQVPAVNTLINLVPGFSKKGPINRPVLVQTANDFISIFGDIDRNLEKKGSFFHRTVLNMLNNGPVWALNLLETDDTLDLLEWQSISFASDKPNGQLTNSPYSRFYNRTDFWYRDPDAFLSVVAQDEANTENIFFITNMRDKPVSVFIFKSSTTGYNVTLESWYQGKTNVPTYLNPLDYVSDYLVSVLVVDGDWSNYAALSVDVKWSKYFNTNGLITSAISNFMNDRSVTVLNYYATLSIIPYFQDQNGANIFIETSLNNDTDTTGIFCAYDLDTVEGGDFPEGYLDLIGSNISVTDDPTIKYMSYNETIVESITYNQTLLNRAGNVFGYAGLNIETSIFGSPLISDVIGAGTTLVTLTGITSYILGGISIIPSATSNNVTINNVSIGSIRIDTIYLDGNGVLGVATGVSVSNQTSWASVPLTPLASGLLPVGLIYVGGQGTNGGLGVSATQLINPLSFALSNGTNSADILINYNSTNEVVFTFTSTANSNPDTNYRKTRLNMIFAQLQSKLIKGSSIITDNSGNYQTITNVTFATSSLQNLSVTIDVASNLNINNGASPQIYFVNNAFSLIPEYGVLTGGAKTVVSSTSGYGIVAPESALYNDYYNGIINTGDYFYPNLFNYSFTDAQFANVSGNNVITLYYNNGNIDPTKLAGSIKISGSVNNNNVFTILTYTVIPGSYTLTNSYNTMINIIVNQSVSSEIVANGSLTVNGANSQDITYIKLYLINNNLTLQFTDSSLVSNKQLDSTKYNLSSISIFSDRSNYKETLEVNSVLATNQILVNASRYSYVKIGDFLQAYVNPATLQVGQVGRNLTRIINKKTYTSDPTQMILTTDSQINILQFGTDLQTYRFTAMESYVNTYNAIVLNGFKMRTASMPDGTETQQNNILNMIASGTPLFNGLTNRNKIQWRYLVDPWGNGLTADSKQQLVDLCGQRLTCLGLLNMPSAKAFQNSVATSFVNSDGTLNTQFIAEGGDPESNPAFLYSFGQGAGQSNVAYFFPYVTIVDQGRPLNVPPASYVYNTFMRKQNTRLASVYPWSVAAGITNGLLTGFGNVEIDLTDDDVTNLITINANPIIYKTGNGFIIDTDFTAQSVPLSALSYIHVREALINLEQDLYQMLLTFQWADNTADIRQQIKDQADDICASYVRNNALYDFTNVMDESNNTSDIIDAQEGVLDTDVTPVKNLGSIINNITIERTGTISTNGFVPNTNNQ